MSASVLAAVSVEFWVAVPLIVTVPVAASLTLATTVVAALALDSLASKLSV